jgi:SAM-dependent methyltransferase
MSYYDTFQALEHPGWAQRFLLWCNGGVVRHLLALSGKPRPRVLEIGPGKGYFFRALRERCPQAHYVALDENRAMLERLGAEHVVEARIPRLPQFDDTFDVVYAAYVVEHLADGRALYDFLAACRRVLAPGGHVVLFAPDCMKQRMEFWNVDYTHTYPTTKRNVTLALLDAGFSQVRATGVSGQLTYPGFTSRALYACTRAVLFFYRYRLFSALAYPLLRSSTADVGNLWYRFYCLAKQPTFMITARRPAD